jgi:pyruvate,orthophosphate dikinase
MVVNGKTYREGDWITIDGGEGNVYEGKLGVKDPEFSSHFLTLMEWAKHYKTMEVKTNAEAPKEIRKAYEYGAEGIGLCRTEHMFFEEERIRVFRKFICAKNKDLRDKALR